MSKKPTRTGPRVKTPTKVEWETRTPNQSHIREAIKTKLVTIVLGPAGTGKSLVSLYTLIDLYNASQSPSLTICRPLIPAGGEELGFLPGNLEEKTDPYLYPIFDILSQHPQGQFLLESPESPLEFTQLALMRGCTFNGAVFVDEGQNLRPIMIEMLLTRIGKTGKMVLTGDITQTDLKKGQSGLEQAIRLFKDDPDVAIVEMGIGDIQRNDFVGRAITAYYNDRKAK